MLTWYALNSKPRQEKVVQQVLAARGIETYLPLWPHTGPQGRDVMGRPFFPSYLFAHLDLEATGLSAIQYMPGVRRVVLNGDKPARVAASLIDEIQQRLARLQIVILDKKGRPLAHGDRVLITGGPLEGYEAIFDQRLSSGQRVRVLVEFLQRRTPCELALELVKKQ